VRNPLALVVALGALACGCGPTLIWTGRTADRMHRVDVMRDGGLDFVLIDGKRRAAYRGVAGWSIATAGDHVAFAARIGRRWVVIHDGAMSAKWDGIGELQLSADNRLVYIAERGGGWHVVTGTAAGPRVDAVLRGTLTIAGSHVAYVAVVGSKTHVVIDGVRGEPFDGIGQLSLTAEGRSAYAARRGLDAYAVVGGVLDPRCDGVALLTLGPRGRVAYAASLGDASHLVLDGVIGATVDSVKDIVFRDDGAHVAWISRVGSLDVLALDDAPIAAWPARRGSKLAFRPTAAGRQGPGLAYVLTTEHGEQLVVDGTHGPLFDEVRTPVWSRDGRIAYAARRGARWLIVDGDREHDAGDAVGDPVFAGKRIAFAGRRGTRGYVVVDGITFPFDLVFEDSVAFSADGARWGAVAGDRAREQLFIVIDGTRRVPVAVRELYSAVASGGDESTLRRWTEAELERATPESRR
jgi:hypothetical protein